MDIPNLFYQDEKGSAIVTVLLVLALLTILGVSATNMSTVEQQISGNDKAYKTTLYGTEAGFNGLAKLVASIYEDNTMPPLSEMGFSFEVDSNTFFDQVKGFSNYDNGAIDVNYTLGNTTVDMDVNRWLSRHSKGASLEFITGTSGVGQQSGIEYLILFSAKGQSGTASARTQANYLKHEGINKGL